MIKRLRRSFLFNFFLALLPTFLHRFLRNRFLGQTVSKKARIGFLSIIMVDDLQLSSNSKLSSFSVIKARKVNIGERSSIGYLTILRCKEIIIGRQATIAPMVLISAKLEEKSIFHLGDHSWVFRFSMFEPTHGIYIGKHVGTGGFTLIFTHGAWGNYLKGYNYSRGPVIIEDEVWMGWRVFLLPNVKIGKGAIVSACSFVTRNIKPLSLVAGNPAKEIAPIKILDFDNEKSTRKIEKRAQKIIEDFIEYLTVEMNISLVASSINTWKLSNGKTIFYITSEAMPARSDLELENYIFFNLNKSLSHESTYSGSFFDYPNEIAFIQKNDKIANSFVGFLRRYGVRLFLEYKN